MLPIDPADQADAIAALLDALGIARLAGFVGSSYGAMVGLQFAALHPRAPARSWSRSAAPIARIRIASAWRALQRQAVALGAAAMRRDATGWRWRGSWRCSAIARRRNSPSASTRAAGRQRPRARRRRGLPRPLRRAATSRARRSTAFLRLSESIDLHARRPGTHPRAGDRGRGRRRTGWCRSTTAFALAERLRGATRLRVLRSPYGHDAFLKETDRDRRDPARSAGASRREVRHEPPHDVEHRPVAAHRAVRAGIDRDTALRRGDAAARAVEQLQLRRLRPQAPVRLHAQRQSRPATCSARRWPSSKAAPAAWSPPPAWRAITLVLNALLRARRPAGGAARLLRRQLAPVQRAGEEGRVRTGHRRPDRSARARRGAGASRPSWCGSKRRPTRCCASPTCAS